MARKNKIIVIALGGNALAGNKKNLKNSCKLIAQMVKKGNKIVVTHGNGPQVGNILLQQEYSKDQVPPMPLSVCGAQSQGQMGTMLVESLKQQEVSSVALITHVLVEQKGPAFKNPQKPIGPIYTSKEAKKLKQKGYVLKEVMVGAWRRVVPSPLPLKILEIKGIKSLLEKNLVPITVGGGGIPVTKEFKLVDAVIDKDLASEVLASQLKADQLIILTNVKKVALNFQKPNQKWLDKLTLGEAKKYLAQGHFPPGSMGPKIEAAIKFLEKGGKKVKISNTIICPNT